MSCLTKLRWTTSQDTRGMVYTSLKGGKSPQGQNPTRFGNSLMLRTTVVAVVIGSLWLSAAVADQELFKESRNKKEGSTRTKGEAVVTLLDNGSMKATVNATVKKTGVTGVGKGFLALILLDENGAPIKVIQVSKTVGATAAGDASKSGDSSVTLFPAAAAKVHGAQLDVSVENDEGYPTSLPDLINKVGDLNKRMTDAGLPGFKDLATGGVASLGDSIIRRFR